MTEEMRQGGARLHPDRCSSPEEDSAPLLLERI